MTEEEKKLVKKEIEKMLTETELLTRAALRWPQEKPPEPLFSQRQAVPQAFDGMLVYRAISASVVAEYRVERSLLRRGFGLPAKPEGRAYYATKREALLALLWDLASSSARMLRNVEKEIEKETEKEASTKKDTA